MVKCIEILEVGPPEN